MTKYTVTYLEDDPSMLRTFLRKTKDWFDFKPIDLQRDINSLIVLIIESKVHAVVIDQHLKSFRSEIHYDGSDIVRALRDTSPLLPTFLLTSYVEEAENSSPDVNKIYPKDAYFDDPTFLNSRIRIQIQTYLKELDFAEHKLLALLKLHSKGKLNIKDEEMLIQLDSLLETSLHPAIKVPKALKSTTNEKKLSQLINDTQVLIKEIKSLEQ